MRLRAWPVVVVCAAAFGFFMPASGWGQSIGFLRPEKYQATVGDELKLYLYTGEIAGEAGAGLWPAAGADGPWPAGGVYWMFVRAGGNQENMHEVKPARAGESFVVVRMEQAGVGVIGMDAKSAVKTVSAKEFEALTQSAGAAVNVPADKAALERVKAGEGGVRVQQVDSSKVLVRVTAAAGAERAVEVGGMATSKAGQAGEFRLLIDPLNTRMGGEIPFIVYIDGIKQPKAKVMVTNSGGAAAEQITTDAVGSGRFKLSNGGRWMLEFRDLRPASGREDVDWVGHRAVLTFEVK